MPPHPEPASSITRGIFKAAYSGVEQAYAFPGLYPIIIMTAPAVTATDDDSIFVKRLCEIMGTMSACSPCVTGETDTGAGQKKKSPGKEQEPSTTRVADGSGKMAAVLITMSHKYRWPPGTGILDVTQRQNDVP